MDPAEIQRRLGTSIQEILRAPGLSAAQRSEVEADAFQTLRDAVRAARQDASLLGGFAQQDMAETLAFIHRRGTTKKVQSRQAKECAKILLTSPGWHRAAVSSAALLESLREFLTEFPETVAKLDGPVPVDLQDPSLAKATQRRSRMETAEEQDSIRGLLLKSRDNMESLSWEFACHPSSADFDTATQSFTMMYEALSRLSAACTSAEGDADAVAAERVLSSVDIEWGKVLRFLRSMHASGSRSSQRARMEFVAAKLEAFCPEFRHAAAEEGALPWRRTAPAAEAPAPTPAPAPAPAPTLAPATQESIATAGTEDEAETPTPPVARPRMEGRAPSDDWHLEQHGSYAITNSTNEELVFYVEQTELEFRLKPGKDKVFQTGTPRAHVRINRPGLFGLTSFRTRLARPELRHQSFYHVVSHVGGINVEPIV